MKKMPCLFVRDFSTRPFTITPVVTPGCEWVIEGRGEASWKRDGTACAFIGGALHKRYDVKRGKSVPAGAIPCEPEADPVTGHWPHWIAVGEEPESRWHREARNEFGVQPDGTYELCGPKLQGNPERFTTHTFVRHGSERVRLPAGTMTFDGLREWMRGFVGEGLVWREIDGDRFCKLRRDDFGFAWPVPPECTP